MKWFYYCETKAKFQDRQQPCLMDKNNDGVFEA